MEPILNIQTLRELWQQASENHWLPVQGSSMLPLLHEGDEILISHDLSTARRGDILVFQKADGLVAHRVVRIIKQSDQRNIYYTKGDNCSYFDSRLSETQVLGKVNFIRKNGREYDFTTPKWRIWNRILAVCHLLLGTLFQTFGHFIHSIHI